MNFDTYICLDLLISIWMWKMLEWLILWNGWSSSYGTGAIRRRASTHAPT